MKHLPLIILIPTLLLAHGCAALNEYLYPEEQEALVKSVTQRVLIGSSQPERRAEQLIIMASAIDAVVDASGPEGNGMVIRGAVMAAIDQSHSLSDLDKTDLKLVASIVLRNLDVDVPNPISDADRAQIKSMTKVIRAVVLEHMESIHPVNSSDQYRSALAFGLR